MVRPNRIGIDTGAVMGGVLTCAVLEDDRLGFSDDDGVNACLQRPGTRSLGR